MTKRRTNSKKKFEFKGFINLEFNDAERIEVGKWIETFKPDLEDSMVVMSEAEYKLGVSYDDYNEVYHISATCKYKSSPYFGWCFTLKHTDVRRGFGILRYVYDSLLSKSLYKIQNKSNNNSW